MISCIIPCYGSEGTINQVVSDIIKTFELRGEINYEIILINDSSPDDVFKQIKNICSSYVQVKAIDLAKNFGQHNAIMAGINCSNGELLVFLDDDGQTPASDIWKLLDALDDDCDVVYAKYEDKKHSFFRNIGSKINNIMAEVLIDKPKSLSISSYFACKRFVANELKTYIGRYPYLTGLVLRSCNRIKNVIVNHKEREIGNSGYTIKKLLSLWLNGFTAFSIKPLRMATAIGFFTAMSGFIYGLFIIIRRFFIYPMASVGWSSTMAVLLFIGGMIMLMLGVIGEYIGRTYININNAPQYVIRDTINIKIKGAEDHGR